MDADDRSGYVLSFQSHYCFSESLAIYVANLLECYTSAPWHFVRTGSTSLSFAPDMPFIQEFYGALTEQSRAFGEPPGLWVACIYPEASQTGVLLRAFLFNPVEGRSYGERIDFLNGPDDAGPITLAEQIIRELHISAVEDFEALVRLAKEGREQLWLTLGIHFANRGVARSTQQQWADAIEDHRACIELEPDFGMAYANLGAVFMDTGDKVQAESWLRRCLSIRQDSSLALGDAKELCRENLRRLGKAE